MRMTTLNPVLSADEVAKLTGRLLGELYIGQRVRLCDSTVDQEYYADENGMVAGTIVEFMMGSRGSKLHDIRVVYGDTSGCFDAHEIVPI